jgi:hypothetical protein
MGICFGKQNKTPLSSLQSWQLNGVRWVEAIDTETNHTYYVCPATGESRITLPRDLGDRQSHLQTWNTAV